MKKLKKKTWSELNFGFFRGRVSAAFFFSLCTGESSTESEKLNELQREKNAAENKRPRKKTSFRGGVAFFFSYAPPLKNNEKKMKARSNDLSLRHKSDVISQQVPQRAERFFKFP